MSFGPTCEQIVAPGPYRSDEALSDTPVCAVGRQKSHKETDASDDGYYHKSEHGIAQNVLRAGIAVAVALAFPSHPKPSCMIPSGQITEQ